MSLDDNKVQADVRPPELQPTQSADVIARHNAQITEEMYHRYSSGVSIEALAKEYGFTESQIGKRFAQSGYAAKETQAQLNKLRTYPMEALPKVSDIGSGMSAVLIDVKDGKVSETMGTLEDDRFVKSVQAVHKQLAPGLENFEVNPYQTKIDKHSRFALLEEATELTRNTRQQTYGDFHKNMQIQGEIMNLLERTGLKKYGVAHNAAIAYVVGKLVRMAQGQLHRDNYVDIINYVAQAYESEMKTKDL